MHKNTFILNLILMIASIQVGAAGLSLEEVYQAAIKKTESVPIAESLLRESRAQVDQVRGTFLPTLSAGIDYQRQNTRIGSTGEYDQGSTKISLYQSILAGGRDRANLKAYQAMESAQKYNLTDSKNLLYIQVARSFFTLLSAEKEVENTQKSIDLTQRRIEELQKRKRIGKSRTIEILASEAQKSVLQAQLLAAIGERRIAKNNFSNLTGLDRNTSLVDEIDLPKEVRRLDELLSTADKRPDILSLQASLEGSRYRVKAASSSYFPSLDFNANYYPSRYHFQTGPEWDAMLVLTFPLFSGGIIQAQVREAEEERLQAELVLSQRKREARTEIHTAYNTLVSNMNQLKALEKALKATEQNYHEQEKDYRYSLATNLDVLQALNTYLDTKRTLDRTRYQALDAMAELKALVNEIEK